MTSKYKNSELNENQLIKSIRAGDNHAFRILLSGYKDKIYNTIFGIVQNKENAEDVCQEVFIEIYRSAGQFREESKLSTWIYRISVIKALEFERSRKRKKRFAMVISLFENKNSLEEAEKIHFYHPGTEIENQEKADILFHAIGRLPEKQKTAFILHKLEQLSYEEISQVMKTTLPAVESLLFRAKANLRKFIGDFYDKEKY